MVWKHLGLYKQVFPRLFGEIESRIIYADLEAQLAIIRNTYWNPDTTRESLKRAYRSGQILTVPYPLLFRQCVMVDIDWVYEAVRRWEELIVPIALPPYLQKNTSHYDEVHQMRLERNNFTMIEVSWIKEMVGEFRVLEITWEQMWIELENHLRNNEKIEVEEEWPFNLTPVFKPFTHELS